MLKQNLKLISGYRIPAKSELMICHGNNNDCFNKFPTAVNTIMSQLLPNYCLFYGECDIITGRSCETFQDRYPNRSKSTIDIIRSLYW